MRRRFKKQGEKNLFLGKVKIEFETFIFILLETPGHHTWI
jgi:hypothetical protein